MASCMWSCYGKAVQVCYEHDDCRHDWCLKNAPNWLYGLIADWRDMLFEDGEHYENPLREKFNHGNEEFCRFCGASIPHRPGEGRCSRCIHHRPEPEPIPPWERR